jgi:hypothetical protein
METITAVATAVATAVGAPSPSSAHSSLTTLYVSPYKFVLQDGINFAHRSLSHGIFPRTCLHSRPIKSLAAKLPHRRAHTHGVFWAQVLFVEHVNLNFSRCRIHALFYPKTFSDNQRSGAPSYNHLVVSSWGDVCAHDRSNPWQLNSPHRRAHTHGVFWA